MNSGKGIKLLASFLSLVLIGTSCMTYVVKAESASMTVSGSDSVSGNEGVITRYSTRRTNTNGVVIENYRLEIGGKVLVDNTDELLVVSDGDTIIMGFDWSIPNDDRVTNSFSLDLNTNLQNIQIDDTAGHLSKDAVEVGEYTVTDGVLTVNFYTDTAFFNGDNRYGGLRVAGELTVEESVKPTDTVIDVTMGQVSMTLPYLNKATAEVEKTASDVNISGGKITQTFQISIRAVDGNITVNSLTDTLGSGFSNMSKLTVVSKTAQRVAGLDIGSAYTLEEINNALSTSIIDKDTYIEFQYTVDVDTRIYNNDITIEETAFNNTASVIYNNKVDEPVKDKTTTTVNKPVLTKTGEFSADYSSITWKLSVALNDFKALDFYDNNIVTALIELPSAGLVGEGQPVYLNASDFVYNAETETYDYYYITAVTQEYQQAVSKKQIENVFSTIIQHPDLGMYTYTGIGTATMPGRKWIDKSAVSYEAGELITWKIELTDIPAGITNVQVKDIITNNVVSSLHKLGNTTITVVDENGVETVIRKDFTDLDSTVATTSNPTEESTTVYIKLNNGYIASKAGQDLTIYVTSVPMDTELLFPFQNRAEIYYVEDGKQYTFVDSASISDTSHCMDKEGKASGETTIDYSFYVDMTKIDVEVGKPIYVEDELPEGLLLDTSKNLNGININYVNRRSGGGVTNTWLKHKDLKDKTNVVYEDNKIKLTFTPDDTFYTSWLNDRNPATQDRRALKIDYTAYVADVDAFIRKGETVTFTNTVTGEYNGISLGTASCDVELTPFGVALKTVDDATYISRDIVKYTIDINEKSLDLAGDKLIAQDILGRGLAYILEDSNYPILVEEMTDGETWVPLQHKIDYTYYFATEDNSLVFTIPDEKHLRISYYVRINIRKDEYYTEEVARNTFKLQGINNFTEDNSVILNRANLFSFAWADYKKGSIELFKYWSNGDMTPLPNVEFALYSTVSDGVTLSLGEVIREDIVVNDQGRVTIDDLSVDVIYALMETKTPSGFESNNKPYYFILPGDNMPTLPAGYPIQYLVDGSVLYYENHKVDTGMLEISKSMEGITDWDSIKNNIEFTIKKGERIVAVVKGTDLNETTHSITLPVNVGDYEITEKVTIPEHYRCETTYGIKVGSSVESTGSGVVASPVTVVSNELTKINFNNNYELLDGTLSITKEHTGLDWDIVKDHIKFEIYNENTLVKTITGSELDSNHMAVISLYPGAYTVKEIATYVDGYACVSKYQIDTAGVNSGTVANVTVESEESISLVFNNEYTELPNFGTLLLTKDVLGLDWDSVKENIAFEIYKEDFLVQIIQGTELDTNRQFKVKLAPGEYTVKEVVASIDGYNNTTEYKLNGLRYVSGNTAEITITSAETFHAEFKNTYATKKGTLLLTKNITTLDWDTVKDTIRFDIYKDADLVKTVLGTELDANKQISVELDSGSYAIREVMTDIEGYNCTTSYVVDGSSTQGTEANVRINYDRITEVSFINRYEIDVITESEEPEEPAIIPDKQKPTSASSEYKKTESLSLIYNVKEKAPKTGDARKDRWFVLISLLSGIGLLCISRKLQSGEKEEF